MDLDLVLLFSNWLTNVEVAEDVESTDKERLASMPESEESRRFACRNGETGDSNEAGEEDEFVIFCGAMAWK